jgi:PTH1 family peptidyl-tRNA hydrolase
MAWKVFFKRLFFGKSQAPSGELLFVGLGNIGPRYAATRHNIGFRVADRLADRFEKRENGLWGQADYCAGTLFNNLKVVSIKPRTFMNRSGEAVDRILKVSGVPVSRALVIVDDYHLPLGKMRSRRDGSDGGHNGLASIVQKMGEGFPRLRIGIGPLPQGCPSVEFVLGTFSAEEEALLEKVLPRAVEACLCFAQCGIDEMMNKFNN